MSGKLKPCPFCGSSNVRLRWTALFTTEYEVRCLTCGVRTMRYKGDDADDVKLMAKKAWNRRVTE